MRAATVVALLAVLALAGSVGAAAASGRGLHVVRNRLVDAHGRTVILRGVNRSGTEYACIQGWGMFDGPSEPAVLVPRDTDEVHVPGRHRPHTTRKRSR